MNRSLSGECFNDDFQYKILHVRVKLPHGCVLLSLQPLWLRLGISCRWLMEGRFKSNSPFIYDKNTIMNIMFVVTVPLYLILRFVWTFYGLDVLKNQLIPIWRNNRHIVFWPRISEIIAVETNTDLCFMRNLISFYINHLKYIYDCDDLVK